MIVERGLRARNVGAASAITEDCVVGWLKISTDEFKFKVISRCVGSILEYSHAKGLLTDRNTIIEQYSHQFDTNWNDLSFRLVRAPGKEALARLNDHSRETFQVSITEAMLVEQLSPTTADLELLGVLDSLNLFCED
jgi:hypothetical protein